jgi:hypothetical protein
MTVIPNFVHQSLIGDADSADTLGSSWSWIYEPVGISKNDAFVKPGLLEQINTTADKSDYLWYSLRYVSVLLPISLSRHGLFASSICYVDVFDV